MYRQIAWSWLAWALLAAAGGGLRADGPAVSVPFFLLTNLPVHASARFAEARHLVEARVLGHATNHLQLSALTHPGAAGQPRLMTWGQREITAPWAEYWFFFADDDPRANWAHPCRYIFVARDLSAIMVQPARTPPNNNLEVLIRYTPPPGPAAEVPAIPRGHKQAHHDGAVSNCYAVIISGGCSTNSNGIRYWGGSAFLYSTLTLTYGYPKTNIYTFISDGTHPAVDATDYLSNPYYVNSPTDLDGDGIADTLGEANAANISNVFAHLRGILQPGDQLLVFVTDHGNHTAGGGAWDTELNLWGSEVIRDAELAAWTIGIPCPILFVMQQCYSGGFIDNLDQPQRVIATAASYNGTSSGGTTYRHYDQWSYHWIAAMRGFYPVSNLPWANSAPCNGDLNGDGYVSFREASHYAAANAPENDTPMYADHPLHFGSRRFLMQVTNPLPAVVDYVDFAPFKMPPVAQAPFAVQLAACDQLGRVATNFAGPVALESEADIVNPGVTVGRDVAQYDFLMRTDHRTARTQVIYPAHMLGGARLMDQLSLHVALAPTQTLRHFTIRLRHTDLQVYPQYPTQVVWETDWATVYQADRDIASNGWATFVFTNVFAYDGVHGLMVDYSFSNEYTTASAQLTIAYDDVVTYRSVYSLRDGEFEDPLAWTGTNPPPGRTFIYPHTQFGPLPYRPQVTITPSNLADFVDGTWTGTVSLSRAADNVRIFVKSTNSYWDTIVERFPIRDYLFDLAVPQLDPGGSCRLRWGSGTGYTYRVAVSANLLDGYTTLITNLPATPPMNVYTTAGDSAAGLFRVEEE